MEIRIDELRYQKSAHSKNCWAWGYAFYNNNFLNQEQLLAKLCESNEQEILRFMKQANGFFGFIIELQGKIIAFVDCIRSYPLYYTLENDEFGISNSIELLPFAMETNDVKVKEYLFTGFSIGRDTLINDVKQLQAGEYLIWNKNAKGIMIGRYFNYGNMNFVTDKTSTELLVELDDVIKGCFQRLVLSLENKTVVVPLSGGFDSRLVVQMLRRCNYENVICFSYGGKKSKECKYSKEIAKSLGYSWIYVPQSTKQWRRLSERKLFCELLEDYNNFASIPYIQHCLSACYLSESGMIPVDSVIITGNSGDFIEGKSINPAFLEKELCQSDDLISNIINQHYVLNGELGKDYQALANRIKKEYQIVNQKYDSKKALQICESFNWRERQAKYVLNDVRCYEKLGLEWRLPLWDKELMEFWDKVPLEIKSGRKLYYQYINNEIIGNANTITCYGKFKEIIKKRTPEVAKKIFALKRYIEYFVHPYGWYGIMEYKNYKKVVDVTKGISGFSICSVVANIVCNRLVSKLKRIE